MTGVAAEILRMPRRRQQRSPGWIWRCQGVSVGVGLPDRGDRPPPHIVVLGVIDGDQGIYGREIDNRREFGLLLEGAGQFLQGRPDGRIVGVGFKLHELGDHSLFRGSHRAVDCTVVAYFRPVRTVLVRSERRRRTGPELVCAVEDERSRVGQPRPYRRRIRRDGSPDTGGGRGWSVRWLD